MNVVVMALTTAPLALRRIYPSAVLGTMFGAQIIAAVAVPHTVTFWGSLLPMAIGIYSAARWCARRTVAPLLVLPVLFGATYWIHMPEFRGWDDYAFMTVVVLAAWGAGEVIRNLTEQRRSLDRALEELEEQRDLQQTQVVLQERARIAREMHDVVAHGVSVMVVQAGAARLDLDENDVSARESLLAVEQAGRSVLDELRRTVSLLRSATDPAPDGMPAPGFDDIDSLVAAMRTAGLDVDLQMDIDGYLDEGRGLAVYRVVQEALTNVLRHAGPTSVRVRITADPDLRVEVVDAGRRSGAALTDVLGHGGNGLIGMRERVGMYGGRLDVQPQGNGYALRADIPATGLNR